MKKYKSHKELHIRESLCTSYITTYLGLNGPLSKNGPDSLIDLESNHRPGYLMFTVKGNKFIPIYQN